MVAAGVAMRSRSSAAAAVTQASSRVAKSLVATGPAVLRWPASHQIRVAAMEPAVPGPGFQKPAPKKVAIVQAQRVFLVLGDEVSSEAASWPGGLLIV
jgi:hypothetical protein